jgi:deoxyribodipyrimidine photo-lyase
MARRGNPKTEIGMTSIWWIRRDLRLTDNPALHSSLKTGPVLPVFILDQVLTSRSARRMNFLYEGLHALDRELRARNSYLVIRNGHPLQVLRQLLEETGAEAIFAEEDFTPYARKRDLKVEHSLPLHLVSGQTVHHPASVLKADGTPYMVYTPYSKSMEGKASIEVDPSPRAAEDRYTRRHPFGTAPAVQGQSALPGG